MQLKEFLCCCSLLCISLSANATKNHMVVTFKEGEHYDFLLEEKPTITFDDDHLIVNENASTTYELDNVDGWYFCDEYSTTTTAEASKIRIICTNESEIAIEQAGENTTVHLTNAYGKSIASTKTSASGTATISLPVSKGVYILNIGNQSFKLIRK